jgi:CDP-diacylglycerol--glycerol-3-phosphate 3-phosphatidyltransferase
MIVWTLPNTLTVLRLLAAPGVAVMFLYFSRPGRTSWR